jgi:hypothetical protein
VDAVAPFLFPSGGVSRFEFNNTQENDHMDIEDIKQGMSADQMKAAGGAILKALRGESPAAPTKLEVAKKNDRVRELMAKDAGALSAEEISELQDAVKEHLSHE